MFRSKEKFIITAIRRATPAADPARETGFRGPGGNRQFQRKKNIKVFQHTISRQDSIALSTPNKFTRTSLQQYTIRGLPRNNNLNQ